MNGGKRMFEVEWCARWEEEVWGKCVVLAFNHFDAEARAVEIVLAEYPGFEVKNVTSRLMEVAS